MRRYELEVTEAQQAKKEREKRGGECFRITSCVKSIREHCIDGNGSEEDKNRGWHSGAIRSI